MHMEKRSWMCIQCDPSVTQARKFMKASCHIDPRVSFIFSGIIILYVSFIRHSHTAQLVPVFLCWEQDLNHSIKCSLHC